MSEIGKYIVIEGTDGTGKTTQVDMLADKLAQRGIETVYWNEPDGTEMASEIRTIIKNGNLQRQAETDLLLFTAARLENWHDIGSPALKMGKWVLAARNYISTLVYQGIADNVPENLILETTARFLGPRYMSPDRTIILDFDDEVERAKRIDQRGPLANPDTFESRDDIFQQKVLDGYRQVAKEFALPIISAEGSPEKVSDRIWRELNLDL